MRVAGSVFSDSVRNQSLVGLGQAVVRIPRAAECVLNRETISLLEMKLLGMLEHLRYILRSRLKHEVHHRKCVPALDKGIAELTVLHPSHTACIANAEAGWKLILDGLRIEDVNDLIVEIRVTPIAAVGGENSGHLESARRAAAGHLN